MKKSLDEYISDALDVYEEYLLSNPESITNTELICQLDDCETDFVSTLNDDQIKDSF